MPVQYVRGDNPPTKANPSPESQKKSFSNVGKSIGKAAYWATVGTPIWMGKTFAKGVWEGAKQVGAGEIPMVASKLWNRQKITSEDFTAAAPKWTRVLGQQLAGVGLDKKTQPFLKQFQEDYTPGEGISDILNVMNLLPAKSVFNKPTNWAFDKATQGLGYVGKKIAKTEFGKPIADAFTKLGQSFNVYASRAMTGKTGQYVHEIVSKFRNDKLEFVAKSRLDVGKSIRQLKSVVGKNNVSGSFKKIQKALDGELPVTTLTEVEKHTHDSLKLVFNEVKEKLIRTGMFKPDELKALTYNPRNVILKMADGSEIPLSELFQGEIPKGFGHFKQRTVKTTEELSRMGLGLAEDYEKTLDNYLNSVANIIQQRMTIKNVIDEFGEGAGRIIGVKKSKVTGAKVAEGLLPYEDAIGKKWWLPKEVIEDLNHFVKNKFVPTKNERLLIDTLSNPLGATTIFKASATTMTPRTLGFSVVNETGNAFLSYLGGMSNPARFFQALLPKNKQKLVESGFKRGTDYITEELSLNNKSLWAGVTRASSIFNRFLENNAKDALALDVLLKGGSARDATRVVNKFLFDYGDLSPQEAQLFKKFVPFYTWVRKNLPLQLEQMVKQPVKYLKTINFLHNAQLTADEMAGTKPGTSQTGKAPWLQNPVIAGYEIPLPGVGSVRTPFKDENGEQYLFKPRLPVEDLFAGGASVTSLTTKFGPTVKAAIELGITKKDLFTGNDIFKPGGNTKKETAYYIARTLFPWLSYADRFEAPNADMPSIFESLITGNRFYNLQEQKTFNIKVNQLNSKIDDIEKAQKTLGYKYNEGSLSYDDYKRQAESLQKSKLKALQDLDNYAAELMQHKGITQETVNEYSNESLRDLTPSPTLKKPGFMK
jgi:hypothetical protein